MPTLSHRQRNILENYVGSYELSLMLGMDAEAKAHWLAEVALALHDGRLDLLPNRSQMRHFVRVRAIVHL
jgi:hypothetical protein